MTSIGPNSAIIDIRISHYGIADKNGVSAMVTTYVIVGLISGILFGIMDGLINANPLAVRLYAVFKPIARKSANIPAGIMIDLIYGLIMAGIFLLLYKSLPGETGFVKGLSYGLMVWFFRVIMYAASQWMMYTIPIRSSLYTVGSGLAEMLLIGIFYGLSLHP